MYVCIYIYVCIHMYVCIYIHITFYIALSPHHAYSTVWIKCITVVFPKGAAENSGFKKPPHMSLETLYKHMWLNFITIFLVSTIIIVGKISFQVCIQTFPALFTVTT